MGIFDKADTNARGSEGGIYFLPGNYTVEIQRCKEFETRNGIPSFVAEFKILTSDCPERKPNTFCSYMVQYKPNDKEQNKLSDGNVMDFLRAAYAAQLTAAGDATEPKDIDLTKVLCNDAVGEENPLAGVQLNLYAYNKPTKKGDDFTRVNWSVIP